MNILCFYAWVYPLRFLLFSCITCGGLRQQGAGENGKQKRTRQRRRRQQKSLSFQS